MLKGRLPLVGFALLAWAFSALAQDKLVLQRAAVVDGGVKLSEELRKCDAENRFGGAIFDEAKRRSRRIPVVEPSGSETFVRARIVELSVSEVTDQKKLEVRAELVKDGAVVDSRPFRIQSARASEDLCTVFDRMAKRKGVKVGNWGRAALKGEREADDD